VSFSILLSTEETHNNTSFYKDFADFISLLPLKRFLLRIALRIEIIFQRFCDKIWIFVLRVNQNASNTSDENSNCKLLSIVNSIHLLLIFTSISAATIFSLNGYSTHSFSATIYSAGKYCKISFLFHVRKFSCSRLKFQLLLPFHRYFYIN
jgi:hypothetical protein